MEYWTALATWSDTLIQTSTELPKANSKAVDQQTAGSMVWSMAILMVPLKAYSMDPETTVPWMEPSKDQSTVLSRVFRKATAKDPQTADPIALGTTVSLKGPSMDS